MFLHPGCHFCEESLGFYRRLVDATRGRRIRLVAALSVPRDAAISYLKKASLNVDRVVDANGLDLTIPGTPTLLLLDERGVVMRAWIGRLFPSQEEEVASSLVKR